MSISDRAFHEWHACVGRGVLVMGGTAACGGLSSSRIYYEGLFIRAQQQVMSLITEARQREERLLCMTPYEPTA
eukprot:1146695-Pelagomonas_calceolata.AAC.8